MTWLYCLNTSTIRPTPLLEKIRLAGKHGFGGIEPWINEVYEYVGQGGEVSDVTKAIVDAGLVVPCTIALRGWGEASDLEYPLMLEEAKRRMELAARLGARYIVATPPRAACDLDQIARRYRDLLGIGREIGVKPTMEYIGFFESVFRVDQAWRIVTAADHPDATIILDAFHNFRGGSTQSHLDAIEGRLIAHYHFDDAPAEPPREQQSDPDRVMPGDGILNLKAELAYLRKKGYGGAISLELFNRSLWDRDPDEVVKLGIERLRALCESA
jgi:sugar phosphate isomerase/epimerase